jgi:K+-transporting ATPase ATPase C chain
MNAHVRGNLWLLGLTVGLCCVLYPLTLWAVGRTAFPEKAAGSLLDENGQLTCDEDSARGSRLIAQPFNGPEYFQPRPSAASYNGAASGASNYGANNPKLRYRVAQALGPIVKYGGPKAGKPVGEDIEKWFQEDRFKGERHLVAQWAKTYSFAAQDWVKADDLNKQYVSDWLNVHGKEVAGWKKENPDADDSKPEDFAVPYFVSFSYTFPGTWPALVEKKTPDGGSEKRIEHVTEDAAIQANFFDMWLQDHPDVELEKVPADMVMASGSGLDPHITRKNADHQLERVVGEWAKKTGKPPADVRKAVEKLLTEKASAPFGGLAGVELINVLEVNLELPRAMKEISR